MFTKNGEHINCGLNGYHVARTRMQCLNVKVQGLILVGGKVGHQTMVLMVLVEAFIRTSKVTERTETETHKNRKKAARHSATSLHGSTTYLLT